MRVLVLLLLGCSPAPAEVVFPLWLGGDVHLGATARGGLEGFDALLSDRIGIVNLEGPLGQGQGSSAIDEDRVVLVNPVETPRFLQEQGVAAIGFVNNHQGDLGEEGQRATLAALARQGILAASGDGIGGVLIPYQGQFIAFIAVNLSPDEPAALAHLLRALLADARSKSQAQIVAFHVSGPPSYLPRPELEAAVDVALEQGADLVVAHGTHALARVERRGDAVVAWGLGNLWFDCPCTTDTEAMLLRVDLGRERVLEAGLVPIRAGLGGAAATPSGDPEGIYDLLEGLGSPALRRAGAVAWL